MSTHPLNAIVTAADHMCSEAMDKLGLSVTQKGASCKTDMVQKTILLSENGHDAW